MSAGAFWVETNYLHWRNASNTEYRFLGTTVSTTPGAANAGGVWIEGADLHYVTSDGTERLVDGVTVSSQSGTAGALWIDSAWAENLQLHWLDASQIERYAHQDVAHADVTHLDVAHIDVTHIDTAASIGSHMDTHSDETTFADRWPEGAHGDHCDVASGPPPNPERMHDDTPSAHQDDSHHSDSHCDEGAYISHDDTPHSDTTHSDTAFADTAHSDNPTTV